MNILDVAFVEEPWMPASISGKQDGGEYHAGNISYLSDDEFDQLKEYK